MKKDNKPTKVGTDIAQYNETVVKMIQLVYQKYNTKVTPDLIGQTASSILSERIHKELTGRMVDLETDILIGIIEASHDMVTTGLNNDSEEKNTTKTINNRGNASSAKNSSTRKRKTSATNKPSKKRSRSHIKSKATLPKRQDNSANQPRN